MSGGRTGAGTRQGVAAQLVAAVEQLVGAPMPVRLRAWDGSEAGPEHPDGPVVVLRHRRALRRLLWNPGELGLARAFVAGELDVEGDLTDGLARFWGLAQRPATDDQPTGDQPTGQVPGGTQPAGLRLGARDRLSAAALAVRLGVLGPRPRPPAAEARLSGGLHTRGRDRAAISHHYDLSNAFYQFLLDPRMAYSCGYWTAEPTLDGPPEQLDRELADAQRAKLDLICRKLDLRPGMRLLDVGCGWAALPIHAAQHYGVQAVGITLSAQQQAFGTARVRELGLADRVSIRLQDYRALRIGDGPDEDRPFDAVASIEMGEHVGQDNYPTYAAQLHRVLRPRGRALVQQMSRGAAGADAAPGGGAFMERYVAPDMHMRPLGSTLDLLERSGLEVVDVHALREHYVHTVRPWLRTLERNRAQAERLVGPEQYRVWLLYLAGAALAFEENRMGVHQVLLVRPDAAGRSGLPPARPALLGADPATDPTADPAGAPEPGAPDPGPVGPDPMPDPTPDPAAEPAPARAGTADPRA